MSLFQESIVRKYLSTLEPEAVEAAFEIFKSVYSPSKIQKIKALKEEQYQEGFLKDVFGSVLGYSVFPDDHYNIETEKKNETDSKKADGAILKDQKVIGVIELKDNKTNNLDSVKEQAFGYKNNHKDCSYVISSNFHKLRFYVDDATEYEEFDLYDLNKETFRRFYLYLRKEGLLDKNIPKLLRQETRFHEENITKSLYRDYSQFKNRYFQNAVKNNPQYDKLTVFQKSQKFLDKLLFVLFAEDKGILTTNTIVKIVEKWQDLKSDAFDNPKPLYKLVILFLNNLYTGKKDQQGNILIPEFGGELFAPDPVLDALVVDDEVLSDDLLRLSKYDFSTDVDVNILGHIFEHSLNEIEEVEAELRGEEPDKAKGKRKKDGVFYTPKYITKYIVNNTLGKLCKEKKEELGIEDSYDTVDFLKVDGKLNEKGKGFYNRVNRYKEWLFGLKILDPACGSGAFLNEALNFLIEEHTYVDDIIAELTNTPLRLFDTDITILENNIFGVDINEESVEIAKLSLWLRTARPNRKLNNLNNNIKCGNSLINDPAVAGEKAFDWQQEFPQVFELGGFDVVIGNPPYVPTEFINNTDKSYFERTYKSAFGRINLYPIFYEKGINLIKTKGMLGFISPYTILKNQYYIEARKYILKNTKIIELVDFKDYPVFQDAIVDSIILILKKEIIAQYSYQQISNIVSFENHKYTIDYFNVSEILENEDFSMLISLHNKLIKKIIKSAVPLKTIINFNQGIITGGNAKHLTFVQSDLTKKVLTGSDFNRYSLCYTNQLIIYDTDKLHRPRRKEIFEIPEKLLLRQTGSYPICMIDDNQFYTLDTVHNGILISKDYSLKFILTLINSKLLRFLYQSQINEEGKVFAQVKIIYVDPLPIIRITIPDQQPLIEKADQMLTLNKQLQEVSYAFERSILRRFSLEDLPASLKNWFQLSYTEFLKELTKKKVRITLSAEAEWEPYFIQESAKALAIKETIQATDREIDQMVYALYGLTDDEIKIVEGLS